MSDSRRSPACPRGPLLALILPMLAAAFSAAPVAHADWATDGSPVCTAQSSQLRPLLATDGNGGGYIAWVDYRPDAGIYVQRVLSNGQMADGWPANGLWLSIPHIALSSPDVTADGNGNAYICWGGDQPAAGYGVYLQKIDPNGSIVAGWPAGGLVVRGTGFISLARAVSDDAGGVLVEWQDGQSLWLKRIASNGSTAAGWPVEGRSLTTTAEPLAVMKVIADGSGGAISAWRKLAQGVDGVYAQRIDGTGARPPGWPADGVPVAAGSGTQGGPSLVGDGAGGAIITWHDERDFVTTGRDIYAQRIRADGTTHPDWPAGGLAVCTAPGDQTDVNLGPDGAGGAIIVWADSRTDVLNDLYALRVTAQGEIAAGWPAQGVVVCGASGVQSMDQRAVIPDGSGGALIAWEDYRGADRDIYVQHLLGDGARATGWPADGQALCGATGQQDYANAIPNGLGGAIVTWEDSRAGTTNENIYAARINADGSTPVLVSLVGADATPERVRLRWNDAGRMLMAATVERCTNVTEWTPVGRVAADGLGDLGFEDRDIVPGGRYGYRLSAGGETYGEVWVDVPGGEASESAVALSLRVVAPSSRTSIRLAYTLPGVGPASIELFDIRGRLVLSRAVVAPAAGAQVIDIGAPEPLRAGVYLVRLSQDDQSVVAKAIVAR